MLLRTLLCPLLALPLAGGQGDSPAGSAAESRSEELQGLVTRVEKLGDGAPSGLFYRIAAGRDAEAFFHLKDALPALSSEVPTHGAYGAATLFKGSAIEEQVADWLVRRAFKAPTPAHQAAATSALASFWTTRENSLIHVLRNHPSATCRRIALEPLLPTLVARADRSHLKLVLGNASLAPQHRVPLVAALRSFVSPECNIYLAGLLRDERSSSELKLVILNRFAEREGRVVNAAIGRRLEDPIDEVRMRALDILADSDDPITIARLRKVVQVGDEEFVIAAILSLAQRREGSEKWVAELYAFTQSQSRAVREGAARALGRVPTRDALTLLHRLLRDDELQVRLAALEMIGARRQIQSIPRLINALGPQENLFTHEVAHQLRLLTGVDHGSSQKRWRAWFEAEGGDFRICTLAEASALEEARQARRNAEGEFRTASFYGVHIESNYVSFVLDTSGSMADEASGRFTTAEQRGNTRLAVAKDELSRALRQLLDGVHFNVITFASEVTSFESQLVELNDRSRKRATKEIDSWTAAGGTAIYDALRVALSDRRTRVIYLMTDGDPTTGQVIDPIEIRERIGEIADRRGVKIHGISIGKASRLLRWLAEDTGGVYTEIR